MKVISENYKKVLEHLEALSDEDEKKSTSHKQSYSKQAPKDLISSLFQCKSNKIHIPKVSSKNKTKPKKPFPYLKKQETEDLSELFLHLTKKWENKENSEM